MNVVFGSLTRISLGKRALLYLACGVLGAWGVEAGAETGCGFPVPDPTEVLRSDGAVPLVFREISGAIRKPAAVESTPESQQNCQTTRGYLSKILDRLIQRSGLQALAWQDPPLKLEYDCGRPGSLPIARVSARKILRVLSGLPRRAASEDAIASVLAHELAHVTLRHHERFARFIASEKHKAVRASPLTLRRGYEREADITGLKILVNAGYDPVAAIDHLKSVEELASQPAFRREGSSGGKLHDAPQDRVQTLREQITQCGYSWGAQSRTPVDARVREELAKRSPAAAAAAP